MSRLPRSVRGSFLAVSLFLAASPGCGPKFGQVSGEIKYKGKPVPSGVITFFPKERGVQPGMGAIKDGKYTIQQAPVGEVAVAVHAPPPPKPPPKKGTRPTRKKSKVKEEDYTLPARFSDPATSGLSYTVTEGEQTKNFDLQP